MKRILLFSLFAIWGLHVNAQTKGAVKGSVIDSATNLPVDYATIALFAEGKEVSTNGALADDKGLFTITEVPVGTYRVVVNFLGYVERTIPVIEVTAGTVDLGKILLTPSATQLSAVDV